MDVSSSPGSSNRTSSVRILTSPEELAEAIARAREFERRNAEFMATRAQRHEAALARFPTTAGSRWITPLPGTGAGAGAGTATGERLPSLPESA